MVEPHIYENDNMKKERQLVTEAAKKAQYDTPMMPIQIDVLE